MSLNDVLQHSTLSSLPQLLPTTTTNYPLSWFSRLPSMPEPISPSSPLPSSPLSSCILSLSSSSSSSSSVALSLSLSSSSSSLSTTSESNNNDKQKPPLRLMSEREQKLEQFLKKIIDELSTHGSEMQSATELAHLWKDEALQKISCYGVTLFHKLQPLVQLLIDQKLTKKLNDSFVTIATLTMSQFDMASRYQCCFNAWIDAEAHVTFKATNKRLLGNISPKDMFILTFFIFCTCRRVKNDNLLQLGLVGCSTSGKSTIFESCLMEGSHITTFDQGVGRFQVGNKTIIMFHDVDIRFIAASRDTEKIKTIARTEPTVTKIQGTVNSLKPIFLFYSSNERLMNHRFNSQASKNWFQVHYPSQVQRTGYKRVTDDTLAAIQHRFIEAFVRSPPPLESTHLPVSSGFQRLHGVLGVYERVIGLMNIYQTSDFTSPVVQQYILQGLAANHATFKQVFDKDLSNVIRALTQKHILCNLLQQSILERL